MSGSLDILVPKIRYFSTMLYFWSVISQATWQAGMTGQEQAREDKRNGTQTQQRKTSDDWADLRSSFAGKHYQVYKVLRISSVQPTSCRADLGKFLQSFRISIGMKFGIEICRPDLNEICRPDFEIAELMLAIFLQSFRTLTGSYKAGRRRRKRK